MIFADSSFWIGLIDELDDNHAQAARLLERSDRHVVTSNHVVGETWTFLRRRFRHDVANTFLNLVDDTEGLRVEFTTRELERDAWGWLRRHDERPYSFVDATSFALMRHLRIREAFAFDSDFTAAGFVELRA